MKPTKRFRMRFIFWLDLNKEDEARLADEIEVLKASRTFVQTIRDGIRLILDLRNGSTAVLEELFPWIVSNLEPVPVNTPGLENQLDRLELLLLQQGNMPIQHTQLLPSAQQDLDFDIQITDAKVDEDNKSTWNFLIASAANVWGDYDGLADDVVEYGLRTGRIKPDQVKQSKKKTKDPGKITGSNVEFKPPDELEIAW